MNESCPRLVKDDLVELTNGVRITDRMVRELGRGRNYRNLADAMGISYLEFLDAVSLLRTGEKYDGPYNDIQLPD